MDGISYTLQWAAPSPPTLPIPIGDLDLHLTLVPRTHPSPQPKGHLDRFSHFCKAHDHDRQTDRQTDYATRSVTIVRIYVRSTAMRPKNINLAYVRSFQSIPALTQFHNRLIKEVMLLPRFVCRNSFVCRQGIIIFKMPRMDFCAIFPEVCFSLRLIYIYAHGCD